VADRPTPSFPFSSPLGNAFAYSERRKGNRFAPFHRAVQTISGYDIPVSHPAQLAGPRVSLKSREKIT